MNKVFFSVEVVAWIRATRIPSDTKAVILRILDHELLSSTVSSLEIESTVCLVPKPACILLLYVLESCTHML
jgi:hypothetical protein